MFAELTAAAILLALTVIVHAVGMTVLLRWMTISRLESSRAFWAGAWLLIRIVWSLIAIHLVEVAVWALFYWWQGCQPDLESAFYFAGVTYTTVGYGDLLLPRPWRLLGPVEGLTGILMCGLSTGLFFALVSRLYGPQQKGAQG